MRLGLRWQAHDVLVKGTPRDTRLIARYTVHVDDPCDNDASYRGIQYARLSWGRVKLDDILPDTQAVAKLPK